ncbi:right-handed parallel beta-helix repeat-containing protein [candidate division KSB1 bacterium]|nr:right-handed parallel beta-helix repeat-containing protein [candidate division KSB1 bacterium]
MIHYLGIALAIAGFSTLAAHAEPVAGNVTGRWTHAQSPYVVTGDLLVPRGERLEIESRVEIVFTGHYKFVVEGALVVDGSKPEYKEEDDHHVVFKASAAATEGWAGIRFLKAGAGCKLKNVVISGGNAQGEAPDNQGGAVYCDHTELEIVNAAFEENRASGAGAAVAVVGGEVDLTNVAFTENSCPGTGGTVFVSGGAVELTNAALSENRGVGLSLEDHATADLTNFALTDQQGEHGWGIWCSASKIDLTNAAVSDNSQGGIKLIDNSRAKLTTTAVSGKNALDSDATSQLTSTLSAISDD